MFGNGQQARSSAAPQPDWVVRRPAPHLPDVAGQRSAGDDADYLAMLDQLDARLEHFQCMLVIIAAQSGEGTQPRLTRRRKSRRR